MLRLHCAGCFVLDDCKGNLNHRTQNIPTSFCRIYSGPNGKTNTLFKAWRTHIEAKTDTNTSSLYLCIQSQLTCRAGDWRSEVTKEWLKWYRAAANSSSDVPVRQGSRATYYLCSPVLKTLAQNWKAETPLSCTGLLERFAHSPFRPSLSTSLMMLASVAMCCSDRDTLR